MSRGHAAAASAGVLLVLGSIVAGWAVAQAGSPPPPPVTQQPVPLVHVDIPRPASPTPSPDAPRPRRVLAIGNSFATGAVVEHLSPLARAGGHDLTIGVAMIGGASLQVHAANAASGAPAYTAFHIGPDGTRRVTERVTLDALLGAEAWDVITVQQASALSGFPDRLAPALGEVVAHVRSRVPGARILVHQTWAYAWTTTAPAFAGYDRDQCGMYAGIVETYDRAVARVPGSTLIPTGTALQLARADGIGEEALTGSDGMHLNTQGQFLAALTWYEALFGQAAPTGYRPEGLGTGEAASLGAAAHEAIDWRDGSRFVVPCRPQE